MGHKNKTHGTREQKLQKPTANRNLDIGFALLADLFDLEDELATGEPTVVAQYTDDEFTTFPEGWRIRDGLRCL
eukprot:2364435-Amphidinium_carterae.1